MSRSGKPREEITASMKNIQYVKGDCLHRDSFKDLLHDVDGIIHTVGALVEKSGNPELTYEAMNRDACINMADELGKTCKDNKKKKTFVYLSSEKAPPFLQKYLSTKLEAEKYLLEHEEHL